MLRENGHDAALQQQCVQWRAARQEHEQAWQRVMQMHQDLDLRGIPGAGLALQTLETSHRRLHRRQALKLLGGTAMVAQRHGWPETWMGSATGPPTTPRAWVNAAASRCQMAL